VNRQEYIVHGRNSVAGWFTQRDAMLFDAIDVGQRAAGITGDLLEIGCYQGTSAILLGYMKQTHERLVICDLFDGTTESPEDDVERSRYYTPNFGRQMFEDNYRRFHTELPEIIGESSTTLRDFVHDRTFRFIHIDGSHAYDQVRKDLLLAKELLVPGGVVAFDDLLSPHTPGVTAAVWEGVANDGLIPMMQTIKFYGTWESPPVVPLPDGLTCYQHEVRGHVMTHVEG
jgi:predicted O-methyltransferase YrrM